MKKFTAIVLLFANFVLCSCSLPKDDVLESLGKYTSKTYYTSGGFQDFTDYAIYTFDDVDLGSNAYLHRLTPESLLEMERHIANFENWISIIRSSDQNNEVVVSYDFDRTIISDADYLYIYDDPDYPDLGCYNVYFFDMESMTLYYFHNNI